MTVATTIYTLAHVEPDDTTSAAPRAVKLDRFLRGLERRALRIAELSTGHREDALELVQDAMLGFVRRYGDKPEADWAPLFHRVLDTRIVDWHRRVPGPAPLPRVPRPAGRRGRRARSDGAGRRPERGRPGPGRGRRRDARARSTRRCARCRCASGRRSCCGCGKVWTSRRPPPRCVAAKAASRRTCSVRSRRCGRGWSPCDDTEPPRRPCRRRAGPDDARWLARTRTALDDDAQAFDAATLSALNRARQKALDAARTAPRRGWLLPVAFAAAASAALAVVLVRPAVTPVAPGACDTRRDRPRARRRRRARALRRLGVLRVARRATGRWLTLALHRRGRARRRRGAAEPRAAAAPRGVLRRSRRADRAGGCRRDDGAGRRAAAARRPKHERRNPTRSAPRAPQRPKKRRMTTIERLLCTLLLLAASQAAAAGVAFDQLAARRAARADAVRRAVADAARRDAAAPARGRAPLERA